MSLADKVIFISGGSRGIGRSIALRAARDGAKVVIASKTKDPHPKLPGTVYTVAEEIEKAGGKALPCVTDIRFEDQVKEAVDRTIECFGGIDILVNNASAISLTKTLSTNMKSYDLMQNVNTRGTFLCSKHCIPWLKKAANPHILTLSPPLNMAPKWFSNHLAYTLSKYGMSMCVLGLASELRPMGIAVNALWPRTTIYTAATKMLGGEQFAAECRKPEIMSDAAYAILTKSSADDKNTGNFFVDEDVLREQGVTNFDQYSVKPGSCLAADLFLDLEPNAKGTVSLADRPLPVEQIFRQVEEMLSPEVGKKIGASFHFRLTGREPGEWFLDLRPECVGVGKATGEKSDPNAFDCRFELSSENLQKMFLGGLPPIKAFLSGDLNIDGDVYAALKLQNLLKKMQS